MALDAWDDSAATSLPDLQPAATGGVVPRRGARSRRIARHRCPHQIREFRRLLLAGDPGHERGVPAARSGVLRRHPARAKVRADRARRRPPAVVLPERRSSLARRDLPPSATATVARLGNPGRVGLCTPSVTGADHFKAGFSARWRRRTTQTALPSRPPTLIALATRSMLVCRGGWLETHADG